MNFNSLKFKIKKTLKICEVKNMESGIIPAIISFFFPGIGQALTDGKPTGKWIAVFIIVLIVEILLSFLLGLIGSIIALIISIVFAYDAYANLIEI